MSEPLTPSPALLCKLGSILVHAEEFVSPTGHPFDGEALKSAWDSLPVAVVKDVVTLGGISSENGEPYTVSKLKQIKDEAR